MEPLSARDLLNVWEAGRNQPTLQQALLLLAAASPELPKERLAHLPIGRRDALLLRLRQWSFGNQLSSVVACPICHQRLEFTLDSRELTGTTQSADSNLALLDTYPASDPNIYTINLDGYLVAFRLPDSTDLAALSQRVAEDAAGDLASEQNFLLARCLVSALATGSHEQAIPVPLVALPAAVVAAIQEQMEVVDPQANLQIALTCPACLHEWSARLDIVTFFWGELDDWARRTLQQVHQLAMAYGWRETETLALSAWRRQLYLQLINGAEQQQWAHI